MRNSPGGTDDDSPTICPDAVQPDLRLMSLLVSSIATFRAVGFDGVVNLWASAWLTAWLFAFPAVMLVAPLAPSGPMRSLVAARR